jgi:hypothetical protein
MGISGAGMGAGIGSGMGQNNQQFFQPIYRGQYQDYGNPYASNNVSQYGMGQQRGFQQPSPYNPFSNSGGMGGGGYGYGGMGGGYGGMNQGYGGGYGGFGGGSPFGRGMGYGGMQQPQQQQGYSSGSDIPPGGYGGQRQTQNYGGLAGMLQGYGGMNQATQMPQGYGLQTLPAQVPQDYSNGAVAQGGNGAYVNQGYGGSDRQATQGIGMYAGSNQSSSGSPGGFAGMLQGLGNMGGGDQVTGGLNGQAAQGYGGGSNLIAPAAQGLGNQPTRPTGQQDAEHREAMNNYIKQQVSARNVNNRSLSSTNMSDNRNMFAEGGITSLTGKK